MPTAIANGKEFTFPEGTTPEQMGQAIDEYFNGETKAAGEAEKSDDNPALALSKRGGRSASVRSAQRLGGDKNQGNALDAVYEPAKAILGGMANQSISGLAGLGNVIQSYDSAKGAQRIKDVQESLPDFSPQTEAGKKGLQTVGDLMQAGIDIVNYPISGLAGLAQLVTGGGIDGAAQTIRNVQDKGLGQAMGDAALEATNNPALATLALMGPDIVASAVGGKTVQTGINKALSKLPKRKVKHLIDDKGALRKDFVKALEKRDVTPENIFPEDLAGLPDNIKPKQAVDMIIRKKLKQGSGDGFLATKKLDSQGFIIDDDIAKRALDNGFDAGDIQMMRSASEATKRNFGEMVNIRRRIQGNKSLADSITPSNVIGRSAMDRVYHIQSKAREASNELNRLVKNDLQGLKINADRVQGRFLDELENLNIKVMKPETGAKPIISFKGSNISNNKGSKKIIKETLELLAEDGPVDAARAHILKRQLDDMIDYKRSSFQLTPSGEKVAKAVRREINEAIRDVSPEYAQVNDLLSNSLQALDDFQSVMGSKFDINDLNAGNKAGLQLRKMISKYAVKDDQIAAINQLDDWANALDGNFKDDVKILVRGNKMLEKRFGPVEEGSFSAETQQGFSRALRSTQGAKEALLDEGAEYIRSKLFTKRDLDAYQALSELTGYKPTRSGLPATIPQQ